MELFQNTGTCIFQIWSKIFFDLWNKKADLHENIKSVVFAFHFRNYNIQIF